MFANLLVGTFLTVQVCARADDFGSTNVCDFVLLTKLIVHKHF